MASSDFIYDETQYVRDLFWHLQRGPVIISVLQLHELKLTPMLFARSGIKAETVPCSDTLVRLLCPQQFHSKFISIFPRYKKGKVVSWDVL